MSLIAFEEVFHVMKYPAGEQHVSMRFTPPLEDAILASHVRNFEDLGILLTANDILRSNGRMQRWFVPYFPFARHDRKRNSFDGLELKRAIEMVREMDITVLDAHSDVLGSQLPQIHQSDVVRLFCTAGLLADVQKPVFVVPDQGATKKAMTWAPFFSKFPVLQGLKHRDPATGHLSGFDLQVDPTRPVPVGELLDGADVIIVDDICDGGGTYIGLAEVLRERYAIHTMTLAVSHGLFTKGLEVLIKDFQRIFSVGRHAKPVQTVAYYDIWKAASTGAF